VCLALNTLFPGSKPSVDSQNKRQKYPLGQAKGKEPVRLEVEEPLCVTSMGVARAKLHVEPSRKSGTFSTT
jgi:hypothetical protein